jgi:hypothetical protein
VYLVVIMPNWANELTLGQLILFITTVAGFLSVAWKEHRNRQWAIEDRKLAAAERERNRLDMLEQTKVEARALLIKTEAIAEAVKIEALAVAEKLRIEAEAIALKVSDKLEIRIEEAKVAAHNAFQEANHVNGKMDRTAEQIKQLTSRLLVEEDTHTDDKLDKVIATADSIEEKVDRLSDRA